MLFLKTLETNDFIKSMIMCFGAPVIEGLKCAMLLNISRPGENVKPAWDMAKGELSLLFGVEFAELICGEQSVIILLYRREMLLDALGCDGVREFLSGLGYDGFDSELSCIETLKEKFQAGVPHEIGVFLGYPLEDVKGFIDNGWRNSKLVGYWKVYGDEISAMKKFEEYKRAETGRARSLLREAGFAPARA
jgi:hypothetical protein